MRWGVLLLMSTLPLGCGKKAAPVAAEPAKKAPERTINVATPNGSAEIRDPASGARRWNIAWKSSALTLGERGIKEGTMNGVSGTIFAEGEKKTEGTSTFTADAAFAERTQKILRLEKRVVVRSPEYGATLTAQKLEWLPGVKRLKATGNVIVRGEWGTIGPTATLLATPDLKRVGTPESFDRP